MSDPRVVCVTGGTKGLGRAIVAAFLARGDTVWSLARSAPSEPEASPRCHDVTASVTDRAQLDDVVSRIVRESGRLDVWINNAGFGMPVAFHDGDNSKWDEMMTVNFGGTVNGTRAALGALTRPGGTVINIASVAGLMAPNGHSAYATAKAAVIALTRANAVEFAQQGIRFNAIAPGPLDTAGFRAAGGDPVKRAASIPTRRMVDIAEVAAACVFLADPNASITGQTLVIDGGSSAAGCYR